MIATPSLIDELEDGRSGLVQEGVITQSSANEYKSHAAGTEPETLHVVSVNGRQ